MNQVEKHIVALTNLYGQVSVIQVMDIYNMQNEDQISVDEIVVYYYKDLSKHQVYSHKKHFVHEAIIEFKKFGSLRRKKGKKPCFIPEQEELLRYSDKTYYEKPKQYYDLYKYAKQNLFNKDHDKAELFCENIRWKVLDDFNMREIYAMFDSFGIDTRDEILANRLMQIVIDLSNNARLWENNGFTRREL